MCDVMRMWRRFPGFCTSRFSPLFPGICMALRPRNSRRDYLRTRGSSASERARGAHLLHFGRSPSGARSAKAKRDSAPGKAVRRPDGRKDGRREGRSRPEERAGTLVGMEAFCKSTYGHAWGSLFARVEMEVDLVSTYCYLD